METLVARAAATARTRSPREEAAEAEDDVGRQFVVALARGLSLLKLFASPDAFYSNSELARLSGLSKPTVSRLTFTLARLGYLGCCANTGRYSLGTLALSL